MEKIFSDWRLLCRASELNVGITLNSGQVFTWRELKPGFWAGVIGFTCFVLRQADTIDDVFYCFSPVDSVNALDLLVDFFQLKISIASLYKQWIVSDESGHFRDVLCKHPELHALRVCRQDPYECLFSFIVSQNNNMKRISSILWKIRTTFGRLLVSLEEFDLSLHAWPDIEVLRNVSIETFKSLGLGYRASYFKKTSETIFEKPEKESFLLHLRKTKRIESKETREFLIDFHGVGRKVADCVMLFSLDFSEIVPVDTHVLQIANETYFKKKTIKEASEIQNKFRDIFGEYAGWAHSALFIYHAALSNKGRK